MLTRFRLWEPGGGLRLFARRASAAEHGFGLIEVTVAMTIMLMGLMSLVYVAANTITDIALARHRTFANSLMDTAIEQVRALPFDTVKLGHRTSDLVEREAADEIQYNEATGEYSFETERIPHGSGTPTVTPLVPLMTSVPHNGVTFTSRTYVTYYDNDPLSGVLRVTTLMDWTSKARRPADRHTRSQSIVYSPTGCLSPATHPFSAPCQAFLFASAGVENGQIDTTTPNFFGEAIDRASLDLAQASTAIQIEQLSTVRGIGQGSAVRGVWGGTTHIAGLGQAVSRADDDPGSAGATAYQAATAPNVGGNLLNRAEGPSDDDYNSIRLTSSSNDSGRSRSTTTAQTTPNNYLCENTTNDPQVDLQPCGESRSRQAAEIQVRLNLKDPEMGRSWPARVGFTTGSPAPDNVRAFVKRYATSATGPCAGTSGNGCIHARAERKLGAVVLGGLPDTELTSRPSGWTNYTTSCLGYTATAPCSLVRISQFSATVTADAGQSAAAPAVNTYSGIIKYWNGSGYTTLSLAPGPSERVFTGGVTTAGSPNISSNTASFASSDVGKCITGAGIPEYTRISSVTNATNAVMTANATAASTAVTATLGGELCIPPVSVSNGTRSLTVTAELRAGGTTTATDATCAVSTPCRELGEATAESPVIGNITYAYTQSGSPVLTIVTKVDLGATSVKATYQDPPSE